MANEITYQEQFLLAVKGISRDGLDKLLKYLTGTNFFQSPTETNFYKGGLVEHSVKVYMAMITLYHNFKDLLGLEWSDESLLIVSLFHDICETDVYKALEVGVNGAGETKKEWVRDDPLPYGYGEKSVYMLSGFLKLSREEAFAIRYSRGYRGNEPKEDIEKAFKMYPLAKFLSIADMLAVDS